MESLLLSPGSWGTQDFCVCALLEWSLGFLSSCGSPVIKSCWPSKSASLETPSPFAGYPGWEAWHRAQKLHNNGRTFLVILFSNLWVSQLVGMRFDLIMIVPLLPSCCGFSFVFGCGISFLVGSIIFLLMVGQQLVAILVHSQEDVSTHPSTLPSWTSLPHASFLGRHLKICSVSLYIYIDKHTHACKRIN